MPNEFQPPRQLADTHARSIRKLRVFNETNDTIPAYAIMQLKRPLNRESQSFSIDAEPHEFFAQFRNREDVIWSVSVCDEAGASRQNPAEFAFNLAVPIPKRSYGEATQDCPAQVLHDGRRDSLPNWKKCGPRRGAWWVSSGGSAFTCMSHDVSDAAGRGGLHTVWLYPRGQAASAHGRFQLQSTTISDGDYVPMTASPTNAENVVNSEGWVTVRQGGLYAIDTSLTLGSPAAPRGTTLTVQLYRKNADETIDATQAIGQRSLDLEEDQYGSEIHRSHENVAFPALENLASGEGVRVRNVSGYSVTVGVPRLRIFRIADYISPPSSQSSAGLVFDTIPQ